MKPFLFKYKVYFNCDYEYTLVYADTIELAYEKLQKLISPTTINDSVVCVTIL